MEARRMCLMDTAKGDPLNLMFLVFDQLDFLIPRNLDAGFKLECY